MQELLRKCGVMEWTSADQFVDQSSSSNLSLKMGSMTPHHQNMTQLGPQFQFRDQDSSSTSQSCPEVASVGGDSLYRFPVHSGQVAFEEGSVGCIGGGQDYGFASHPDYTQPYTFNISHPYYGGLLPSYGYMPQTSIPHNFQGMNMSCARLPLPVESDKGGELVYVNAKQYYAILRRRQYRAKLDAQNKLSKSRKPYLHESRHFHALKRARGPGGRFLNRKEIKEGQHVRNLSNDHVGGSAQAIRPSTGGRMVDGT